VPFTVRVMPDGLHSGVEFDMLDGAESEVMVGRAIGNAMVFDVFALAAGLATATWTVSTEVRLAAATVALSCVGLTYVVANCVTLLLLSTHWTFEQGRKFVPETSKGNAAVPAVAPAGETVVIVGAGSEEAEIVKGNRFERTPELDTSTFAVPAEAMNEDGIVATSCVELTKVVARAEGMAGGGFTAQSTTEPLTKFVPFTVRVSADVLHEGVLFDEVVEDDKELTVGGTIVNGSSPDVPPPGPIVNTSTCAVPWARKSEGGTVALSCVELTYVVASGEVTFPAFTHCTTEHGRRFVPVTVSVNAGLPAAAPVCDKELAVGAASAAAGVERVKGTEAEVPT